MSNQRRSRGPQSAPDGLKLSKDLITVPVGDRLKIEKLVYGSAMVDYTREDIREAWEEFRTILSSPIQGRDGAPWSVRLTGYLAEKELQMLFEVRLKWLADGKITSRMGQSDIVKLLLNEVHRMMFAGPVGAKK